MARNPISYVGSSQVSNVNNRSGVDVTESQYDPTSKSVDVAENTDPLSSIWNWMTGKTNRAESYLNQLGLQEDVHQKALELQQREMDYNSEVAQVQRMQEAGLNVNLMSQGKGSSISSSSEPTAHFAPDSSNPLAALMGGAGSLLSGSGGLGSAVGAMLKVGSEIAKNNSETRLNDVQSGLKPLESAAQIALWNSESAHYAHLNDLNDAERDWINHQAQYFVDTTDLRKEQLQQEINEIKQRISQSVQEVQNKKQEIIESYHRIQNIDADTVLKGSQVQLNNSLGDEARTQSYENVSEAQYKQSLKALDDQLYNSIQDNLGGVAGLDFDGTIAALYSKGEVKKAEQLMDGVVYCYGRQYAAQVQNRAQYYPLEFGMGLGNAVQEGLRYWPFMFMGGRKASPIRGFGR